jgi:hypothetical protein
MQDVESGFGADDFAGPVIPGLEGAFTEKSVETPERCPR